MEGINQDQIKILLLHEHKVLFTYEKRENNVFSIGETYEWDKIGGQIHGFIKDGYMLIKCTKCGEELFTKSMENIKLFRKKNCNESAINIFDYNLNLIGIYSQSDALTNIYKYENINDFQSDTFYKIEKDFPDDEFLLIGSRKEITKYLKKNI